MQPKSFPNTLREHRLRAGLLQRNVASALGLDCTDRLSRWENGNALPSIANLFKLSVIYKCPPQELYAGLYQSLRNALGEVVTSNTLGPTAPLPRSR